MIQKVFVTKKEDLNSVHMHAHHDYEFDKTDVVKRNGGNQCAVTFYDIAPGKYSYPFHYHTASEEVIYIISGEGILETNDGNIPIQAGSTILCPVGIEGAHRICNTSQEKVLSYIDVDTVPVVDLCMYPKTDKIGIFTNDGYMKIYRPDADVPYYSGE